MMATFNEQTPRQVQKETQQDDVTKVLSVACPFCSAAAGSPCRTETGKDRPRAKYHTPRAIELMRQERAV
jgi:hypothetical protein